MGKGGGCCVSKKRSSLGESDDNLPNPPSGTRSTTTVEGQNPTADSTVPLQDGALLRKLRIFIVFLLNVWPYRGFGKEDEERG